MKCLSVRQPYAALILAGKKRREYRSWRPPAWLIGQGLLIHASKRVDLEARQQLARCGLPLLGGRVLGSVLLKGVRGEEGDWAWLLSDPRPLRRPVPCAGRLGLWEFSRVV